MHVVKKDENGIFELDMRSSTFQLLKSSNSQNKVEIKDTATNTKQFVSISEIQDWSIVRNVIALNKDVSKFM